MWFLVEDKYGAMMGVDFIDFNAFLKWTREQGEITLTAPVEQYEPFEIKVKPAEPIKLKKVKV